MKPACVTIEKRIYKNQLKQALLPLKTNYYHENFTN